MKKNLFYLFALICSMGVFTACGDDDDDVKFPVNEELAGTYKGSMDIYYEGIKDPIAEDLIQKVYISKASDSAIKLELRDFSVTVAGAEIPIGTITIDKCTLKQNGDIYEFTGSQELALIVGKCNVLVTGTIGAGLVNMNISVDAVDAGLKVKVEFGGAKLKGNESSEAKITTFLFENNELIAEQPIIDEESGRITFIMKEGAEGDDFKIIPTIEISEKATVSPVSGEEQDFSKPVRYTVIAQDGTTKIYTVSIMGKSIKYSFDEWVQTGSGKSIYELPSPTTELATSSQGVAMLVTLGFKGGFPVVKTDEAKEGANAAKLITLHTKGAGLGMAPAITSGSLFTGRFVLNMGDQLKSTQFGNLYKYKPLNLKGYYKYTPGDVFRDDKNVVIEGKIDEFSIKAILYEIENDNDILTGHDINTSEKRVAIAEVKEGAGTTDFIAFNVPFEFINDQVYDSNKKYKLAIICSSSKWGDAFQGAPGSTLIVDELEVIGE